MISSCTACRGAKKVQGMGCIEQNCEVCKGTGFATLKEIVKAVEPQPTVKETLIVEATEPKPTLVVSSDSSNKAKGRANAKKEPTRS